MTKIKCAPLYLAYRRLIAATVFCCGAIAMMPAYSAPKNDAAVKIHNTAAMNFVRADIESVIQAVGHYTNVNFIVDPRVKGTLTLVSEKPLTKAQAFSLLSSVLRMQGYAVVMGDGYAKVVPEADAKLQLGMPQVKTTPNGNQMATQVFRLNYESAANMVPVLRPLISPNNTINANPGNNTLLITDYSDNLKRLGRIIALLDVPSTNDLEVVTIHHAIATDIAVLANKLLEPDAPTIGAIHAGRVTVLADVRRNAVVIRAPSLARANMAKALIAKLDQPTGFPGNMHVVYLKNADAVKLAQTLRAVVSGDTSSISDASLTPSTGSPPSSRASPSALSSSTASSTSSAPGTLTAGGIGGYIQADAATNTLIITASEPMYRNLRQVIDLLDVRRAQVYIESLIAEVSAEKAAEFGVQWIGLTGNSNSAYRVGGGTTFSSGGNNIINLATGLAAGITSNTVVPGAGMTLGVFRQFNSNLGLGAVAHALENDNNSNILSTPNLITLDNEEAKIMVGQNVPFITGQYTTTASSSATVSPFQTVERKDVGLSLRVQPQISEGGTVKMRIYQETSSVEDSTNAAGIITKKRSIETNVLADDGQIIVLGGLIEDSVKDGVEKVPGLGDIPLIGNLFKYQTRSRKKTNLMVFLRPTVIRSRQQNSSVAIDRYDYMQGVQTNTQPARSTVLPDMAAPILPTLENTPRASRLLMNMPVDVNTQTAPTQPQVSESASKASATSSEAQTSKVVTPVDVSAPVEPMEPVKTMTPETTPNGSATMPETQTDNFMLKKPADVSTPTAPQEITQPVSASTDPASEQ